jgi:hypothetical protein
VATSARYCSLIVAACQSFPLAPSPTLYCKTVAQCDDSRCRPAHATHQLHYQHAALPIHEPCYQTMLLVLQLDKNYMIKNDMIDHTWFPVLFFIANLIYSIHVLTWMTCEYNLVWFLGVFFLASSETSLGGQNTVFSFFFHLFHQTSGSKYL